VNADHFFGKLFKEEVNSPLRGKGEKQLAKKIQIHLVMHLSIFMLPKIFSKRSYVAKFIF
jgi:hypothetical protein